VFALRQPPFLSEHRTASSPKQQLVFDNPKHNALGKKVDCTASTQAAQKHVPESR
jgi:hypothetical protein